MNKHYRRIVITIISLLVVAFSAVAIAYRIVFAPNFDIKEGKEAIIFIDKSSDFDAMMEEINRVAEIKHFHDFKIMAHHAQLADRLKTGRYSITNKNSNREVINMLCAGRQTPVNITFNNMRLPEQLAHRLGEKLMLDSAQWMKCFNDTVLLAKYNITPQTLFVLTIPNTYQVYWNMSEEAFLLKMNGAYKDFWNSERTAKAAAIGLTPAEVVTLASIVDEETNKRDEKAIVAGLYLNRLHRNMLLQSDPTVKYAVGDFTLTQILNKHLAYNSPYNTYIYVGLPPGPIRMPETTTIDAVLNAEQHNYIYMCAKPELNGRHNFATTLAEHNRNAAAYHAALRQWQKAQKQG